MVRNPVERNFVTRFILGLAVVCSMSLGGSAVGSLFQSLGVPFGGIIGVVIGAIAVFAAFSWWYTRYESGFDSEPSSTTDEELP